jgi:nucleoside-diphosphate-sugar epimerase
MTGGSSSLGEVVLQILAARHDVYALARSTAAEKRVEREGATFVVRGDLENPESWLRAAREADAVVHLAGLRLIDHVLEHVDACQPMTVISSASVRNPAHPQSTELQEQERSLCERKRDALVILRPTMIYGSSRDRSVRLLAQLVARLPAVPRLTGGGLIQPILADDVGDAIVTTLGTAGLVAADIGGPIPIRLGTLVTALAVLLDRRVIPIAIPVRALTGLGDVISRWRPSPAVHALAMLRHDRTVAPVGREILGRAPTPLIDGLRLALSRYQMTE